MDGLNDDYDTPWKLAVTRYFPDFIAFYFPRAHAAIDWSHPHVFLDEELAQLTQDAALGKRLLDELVQVHTLDGGAQWVLIHVEKWRLTRLLYLRNWNKQSIIDLYFVIDWMMRLPAELERDLHRDVMTLERKMTMRHICSAERFGIEKGELKGQVKMLTRQLSARFGYSPRDMRKRLTGASDEQLEKWSLRLLSAATLDDVFRDN